MARVELLDDTTVPLTAHPFFADGDPGPIVAALATVPELLAPTLGFVGAALAPGAVSARYTEFAILRTSALQGCQYCVHAHTSAALDAGLTPDEVRGLRGDRALEETFDDGAERALITWIDAMAGSTGPLPADVWKAARAVWPEYVLVELAVTIGATMFLNRFATGFELPAAPDALAAT